MLRGKNVLSRYPRIALLTVGGGISTALTLSSLENDDKPIEHFIKPSFDAAVRASRLLYTASKIMLDYQTLKYGSGSLLSQNEIRLEQELLEWSQILRKAQDEYTSDRAAKLSREKKIELKKSIHEAASKLAELEDQLSSLGSRRSQVHRNAAKRLLELCRSNGGVYVKVGQHLANLDYLVPDEYIDILSALFNDASPSTYEEVRQVIKEDLGRYPEELFDSFSSTPLACASLAQVHVAFEKKTGRKLAIKVQHRGLRESSKGDIYALQFATRVAEFIFPEFSLGWLAEEIAPQLPRELDFSNEGNNSEIAAQHLEGDDRIVIPKVLWEFTSPRVLAMNFEEGFQATDLKSISKTGLNADQISRLVLSVFNRQVFESGFVHCDPHPANVLVREHPIRKGTPQLVLVDHGLYKRIDDDFRIAYAKLWTSMLVADIKGIKQSCEELGVKEMYPLLAAMLTARPFDEILERSKSGSINHRLSSSSSDKAMIKGYAQKFLADIVIMLDTVPRQMLLLFKMNDCMRHISYTLGSPTSTNVVIAGTHASRAVYTSSPSSSYKSQFYNAFCYANIYLKIALFDISSLFRPK